MPGFRNTIVMVASAVLVTGATVMVPAATASVTSPTSAATTTAAATPTAAAMRSKFFHTPSGNIRCGMLKAQGRWSMRCDINQHDWRAPSGQTCREGDYGSSVGMGGKAASRFVCVSDALNPGKALPYGHSLSYGPFFCKSKVKGLKCWNKNAHGWFLSRQRYDLF